MQIEAEKIPQGSYCIRVWHDSKQYYGDYDVVATLLPRGDGLAEVGFTMGNLTNDVNIAIGLKAYELGFKKLRICVSHGHKVSRWAIFSHSDDKFDYYNVDLVAAVDYYTHNGSK